MIIPFHRPYMTEDEVSAASEAIRNGWLTMGMKTIEFEKKFAEYIGTPHALTVNSCTAALHLAVHLIGIKEGDEVIVPSITFAATAEILRYYGAIPVFADVERDTHLIDPADFEKRITSRTKAVIPVHYGGQPCDMDAIRAIADAHSLAVIEDAAHSLPSKYKGKLVGTISDLTAFSFYATKTLATGEGGMITTPREDFAEKIRLMRLHGISRDAWKRFTNEGTWKYDVLDAGFKYNITDVASSIGLAQLSKIDMMNDKRRAIAARYNESLSSIDEIIPYVVRTDRESCHHLYPLRLNLEALTCTRDEFYDELKKVGVHTSVHYTPLYRFTYYSRFAQSVSDYPNSEWVFERMLSLPIFPGMTADEVSYVIESVRSLCARFAR